MNVFKYIYMYIYVYVYIHLYIYTYCPPVKMRNAATENTSYATPRSKLSYNFENPRTSYQNTIAVKKLITYSVGKIITSKSLENQK